MLTLSREEQRALDKYLIEDCGMEMSTLMEGAAHSICRFVISKFDFDMRVIVFAGPGNNGGDAYAVARLLAAFYRDVCVYETKEARELCLSRPDSASGKNRLLVKNLSIELDLADKYKVESDSLIIDGILGTGFDVERGVDDSLNELFEKIHRSKLRNCKVVSIDIPSGVDANTGHAVKNAVLADYTVSFVCPKRGLSSYPGRNLAGEVVIGNLGVPKSVINRFLNSYPEYLVRICDKNFVKEQRIERPKDGHKGTFGKVLIVAGSEYMPGAAMLCTHSSLKSGVGLVKVLSSENTCKAINQKWPEAITYNRRVVKNQVDIDENFALFKSLVGSIDACLIGPGLAEDEELEEWLKYAIKSCKMLVLDAEALNLIAKDVESYKKLFQQRFNERLMPAILTPHPGEFSRLCPDLLELSRMEQAIEMVKEWSVILVLKGASTLTAVPQANKQVRLYANSSGNNGLAKGGSGDILAGLILSLIAQLNNDARVIASAVFIHGYAADLALASLNERSILASDVIEAYSKAFHELEW